MTNCHGCGGTVVWRELAAGGRIPVDLHEVSSGECRYVEDEDGKLVPLAGRRDVLGFVDHRTVCPSS